MIPQVEIDTFDQWKEKLGAFAENKKILPILNMILTRRHFPNCFQYSNDFIAQQGYTLPDIVKQLDEIPFRPLQQMFEYNVLCDDCSHCNQSWKILYPWTGSTNVLPEMLPGITGCKRSTLPKEVSAMTFNGSQWLLPTEDKMVSIVVYFSEDIRVQLTGYGQLGRYHSFKDYKEYMRFVLLVKYLCSGGKFISTNIYSLMEDDPLIDIMKSDNWQTTPSLLWNDKIAALDARVSTLVSSKSDSIKIVNTKFKDQIEKSGSLSDFMEEYYPKMNIVTLAAMCRASEQPA